MFFENPSSFPNWFLPSAKLNPKYNSGVRIGVCSNSLSLTKLFFSSVLPVVSDLSAKSNLEKEISTRWSADMNSDSWLSKNIRPLVLIFLVVSTVLLVFIDAGVIAFEVKASWVDLLQLVLITVIGAYFGGRSLEKTKK